MINNINLAIGSVYSSIKPDSPYIKLVKRNFYNRYDIIDKYAALQLPLFGFIQKEGKKQKKCITKI